MTTIQHITPALLTRARQALEAHGLTVQKLKTGVAALDVDPNETPAYTVCKGRQVMANNISARELVELASRAAGESEDIDG